MGCYREDGMNS